MSKLYVIGDIHGCLNELIKLLALIDNEISHDDKIVFVGDYVDRGPDSKGVIDLLINRTKTHENEHIFLMGNHEDMMISGEYWALNGGLETLNSYGVIDPMMAYSDYWSMIPKDHEIFIKNTKLFYKQGRTVVVHAGLNPHNALDEQVKSFMLWDRKYYGYIGNYHDDEFVVIGHTPGYEIVEKPNQLAIDTACVFGGKLTCAVIQPEFGIMIKSIQVKSEFSYS